MATFKLPFRKAITASKEHANLVIKQLKTPLHETNIRTIIETTSDTLEKHPQFSRFETRPGIYPGTHGNQLYSHYEIGHQILLDRLIKRLKAKKQLPAKSEPLIRAIIGRLYYNVPKAEYKARLNAINRLERMLGTENAERLLQTIQNEMIAQSTEVSSIDKRKTKSILDDMFYNPLNYLYHPDELKPGTSILTLMRFKLNYMLTHYTTSHYSQR